MTGIYRDDKLRLIRLREQLDRAIESDSFGDEAAIAENIAAELKRMNSERAGPMATIGDTGCDETEAVLQALEDAWLRGSLPVSTLPVSSKHRARLAGLLSDMVAVQSFALAISTGDLSRTLKAKGVMAGSFKAVQGSLRHLTWQTGMIANGDFSQRVDFMGEFSDAFNSMVRRLSDAHDQINRYTEELLRINSDLTTEIAERKQAEEALRVSREWLRVTLNSIGDAVLTTDTEGLVTFLNPVAVALTGWSPGEAAGQPVRNVFKIVDEKTGEPAEDIVGRVLREGQVALLANNTALLSRNGSKIPIEDSAAPIMESDGEVLGVVLVFHDVTEKRLVQEQICQARDDLEARVLERTAELEKVNRDLADFNHIAAHDLQEPLRQLITFGDRLVSRCGDLLSSDDRYYLDRIQKLSRRAGSLTRDILEYSTISSRIKQFSRTGLNRIVRDVIRHFGLEIERKGALIEVGELRSLEIDPAGMFDVFSNLISNALKFTGEEKPKIRIYGEAVDNRRYLIYVEDNGIGFDEAYLDKIFVPFQRLHGRAKYEGSGIGLAICRKILEMHGGGITAKSQPNVGSTFILSLPLYAEDDDG